jgi:Fe-S-cluster containining protein
MPGNRYRPVLPASPQPFATIIDCASCEACCCRLEVLLISDTGVPDRYVDIDEWGGRVMARLEDGWCAALDRNTMMCSIYEMRPLICREFEVGEHECRAERAACLGRLDREPDV